MLLSDAHGKIEAMLMGGGKENWNYMLDLKSKMKNVKFYWFGNPEEIENRPKDILYVGSGGCSYGNDWIRDPIVISEARNVFVNRSLETMKKLKISSCTYDKLLRKLSGFEFNYPRLEIHGGDLLVGDDFIFCSKNYLGLDNQDGNQEKDLKCEKFRKRFRYEFKDYRKLIFVGTDEGKVTNDGKTSYFPFPHIDTLLTLGGIFDNKYIVFYGMPKEYKINGEKADTSGYVNAIRHDIKDIIQNLQKQDPQKKFEFIKVPMIAVKRRGIWRFLSFNNAIVEIANLEQKTIWIPSFGKSFKSIEDKARRIFKSKDLDVIQLKNCEKLALRDGGIHCITKELIRNKNHFKMEKELTDFHVVVDNCLTVSDQTKFEFKSIDSQLFIVDLRNEYLIISGAICNDVNCDAILRLSKSAQKPEINEEFIASSFSGRFDESGSNEEHLVYSKLKKGSSNHSNKDELLQLIIGTDDQRASYNEVAAMTEIMFPLNPKYEHKVILKVDDNRLLAWYVLIPQD